MSLDLSRLDPEQREAVTATEQAILVLAGAGSGKTRVLVARFAALVESGVDPGRIVAVTFTKRAAEEMRGRIVRLVGAAITDPGVLRIGTFHSRMARDLRTVAGGSLPRVGRTRSFAVWDEDDRRRAIERIGRDIGQKALGPEFAREVSRAKNELRDPEGGALAEVWIRYEAALRAADAFDYDDLIGVPVRLLRSDIELRARWSASLDHLLVDELQDTNAAQIELIRLLAGSTVSVFGVGDDAQSIYAFRGAKADAVERFRANFPGAREVILRRNYRSEPGILSLANEVLGAAGYGPERRLVAAGGTGDTRLPRLLLCPDDRGEAKMVAATIRKAIGEGLRPAEAAILVRTNAQTRVFEAALSYERLPYRVLGTTAFWARRSVRDAVAWLRTIANPRDGAAYERALGSPARGIGDSLLAALREALPDHDHDWPATLRAVSLAGVAGTAKGRGELRRFADLRDRWAAEVARRQPGALVSEVIEASGLAEAGDPEAAEDRADELREVVAAASAFGLGQLEHFLETAATDITGAPVSTDSVAVATLHAAKGLEWPVVFLAGCEEGFLPHANSVGRSELAEERRLFYVGVTRARRRLILSAAARRRVGATYLDRVPSRFLAEGKKGLAISRSGEDDQPRAYRTRPIPRRP